MPTFLVVLRVLSDAYRCLAIRQEMKVKWLLARVGREFSSHHNVYSMASKAMMSGQPDRKDLMAAISSG